MFIDKWHSDISVHAAFMETEITIFDYCLNLTV